MKFLQWNKVNAVIAGATLALVFLILLQAQWLLHSKKLIEEQFDQKVSMAMCMAVTDLSDGPKTCIAGEAPDLMSILTVNQLTTLPPRTKQLEVRKALDHALAFYDIHQPYEMQILDKKNSCVREEAASCCSMGVISGYNDRLLHLTFPHQTQYMLQKMGFMIGSAILILFFVSTVFALATYYLIQQKKIGERNKDFFNNMAHEFKTPLTNIILANSLLSKKMPQLRDNSFVKITKKEANKLIHQIERVLHLAQIEQKEYALAKEELCLCQLLKEVIEDMAIQMDRQGADIQVDLPEKIVVWGDKFHLSNAFRNIIDNALKYTQESPQLRIVCNVKEKGISLLFKDNGIGIAQSEQTVVFDKFQRVGTGDVHNQKGFGLGLAYVKKVVELHQGTIQIFSELGKGSRFDLFLPVNP
ncbi:MAG: HAMP domain-containing sensor histidine kinase [Bacteroidota bacterium]